MTTETLPSPLSIILGALELRRDPLKDTVPYHGASPVPNEKNEAANIKEEEAKFWIEYEEYEREWEAHELSKKRPEIRKKKPSMPDAENEAANIEEEEVKPMIQCQKHQLKCKALELSKKWLKISKRKFSLQAGQSTVQTPLINNDPPKHLRSLPSLKQLTDPSSFRNSLVSNVRNPQTLADLFVLNKIPDTSLFVSLHGKTRFTLRPCRDVFGFSEQPTEDLMDLRDDEDVYWHLQRSGREYFIAQGSEHNLKPVWTENLFESDVFIAFGWLVESNETGFHRTTNYVYCLNLSTEPMSLWLIYDYCQPDPEEIGLLRIADVPDCQSCYNDSVWDHEDHHTLCGNRGRATQQCYEKKSLLNPQNRGYMEQEQPWDIACLYRDVGDWPKDEKLATGYNTLAIFGPADRTLRVKHRRLNGLDAP